MFTILIDSIEEKDFWYTAWKRPIENRIKEKIRKEQRRKNRMYINDVNIVYYIVAAILGLFVGQIVDWANKRLPEYKKVISREFFTENRLEFKPNYY